MIMALACTVMVCRWTHGTAGISIRGQCRNCNAIFGAIRRLKKKSLASDTAYDGIIAEAFKVHVGRRSSWTPVVVEKRVDIVRSSLLCQHYASVSAKRPIRSFRQALVAEEAEGIDDRVVRRNAAEHMGHGSSLGK